VPLVLFGNLAGVASAQTQADLFDASVLHDVRIFINSRDLEELRAHYRENTYYTADFEWRNIRVRNVGIRSRGVASRNPNKPGLRVDFDRYSTGQQFVGLSSLVLDNLWQHGSMVAETVSMTYFRKMGQPASRESFCRLYINNVYHGVYAIVESVDAGFLARTVGDTSAYLFSFQQPDERYRGEYLGDDLEPYKRIFEPITHELEADTILYSPMRDLFREVNAPVDAVWRERVEEKLDLAQFVTEVALENFIGENDGLLGWAGMNNFFLYRPADSTRHRVVPWDKDSTFESATLPIMNRADENPIFRGAMTYPDLHALYLQVLESAARASAADDWLETEIIREASLIGDAVRADNLKQYSNEEFDAAVGRLIEFARQRSAFVLQEVARLPHGE